VKWPAWPASSTAKLRKTAADKDFKPWKPASAVKVSVGVCRVDLSPSSAVIVARILKTGRRGLVVRRLTERASEAGAVLPAASVDLP